MSVELRLASEVKGRVAAMVARRWREVREVQLEARSGALLDRQAGIRAGGSGQGRRGLAAPRVRQLAEIRRMHGYSRQSDVAELMGVSRPRVSKLESGDPSRLELGTIQSYVAALGGKLRVVADFGETSVELSA
jgi:predicted XRE-type DNA-binding protein